jgi:hypothetical protein
MVNVEVKGQLSFDRPTRGGECGMLSRDLHQATLD